MYCSRKCVRRPASNRPRIHTSGFACRYSTSFGMGVALRFCTPAAGRGKARPLAILAWSRFRWCRTQVSDQQGSPDLPTSSGSVAAGPGAAQDFERLGPDKLKLTATALPEAEDHRDHSLLSGGRRTMRCYRVTAATPYVRGPLVAGLR